MKGHMAPVSLGRPGRGMYPASDPRLDEKRRTGVRPEPGAKSVQRSWPVWSKCIKASRLLPELPEASLLNGTIVRCEA